MTILEVRGLTKRFGGLPAVDGLDLDVGDGETLAVIGPNGAGKSTLLRLISGVDRPTAVARISLHDIELVGLDPHRIRHLGVATVSQVPRVFASMTVRENAAMGAMFGAGVRRLPTGDAFGRADEALELLGLTARAELASDRLNLHEQRLLELARALTGRPRLLLLDEVMAGLDPVELDGFVEVLRRVRDELTMSVVLVEHVMQAVTALADRVVVLHAGRVLAEGPPDEVMRHAAVVDAYLGRAEDHDARR